jgi:hypothetical protein
MLDCHMYLYKLCQITIQVRIKNLTATSWKILLCSQKASLSEPGWIFISPTGHRTKILHDHTRVIPDVVHLSPSKPGCSVSKSKWTQVHDSAYKVNPRSFGFTQACTRVNPGATCNHLLMLEIWAGPLREVIERWRVFLEGSYTYVFLCLQGSHHTSTWKSLWHVTVMSERVVMWGHIFILCSKTVMHRFPIAQCHNRVPSHHIKSCWMGGNMRMTIIERAGMGSDAMLTCYTKI